MEDALYILITVIFVLFFWAAINLIKSRNKFKKYEVIIWFLFILFLPIIGPVFYFLLAKTFHSMDGSLYEKKQEF